ncbi:SHOCT domain-containing protein [Isoptericola aurantiacus]|uniref:SHOCT domain-containing protein n=1 Tax=Isoptericola aurantiacus TaxID=3377839 RepID=UPI003839FB15
MVIRRVGRVGRPGLIGTMARTAVVAGTANAVTRGMNNRAGARAEEQAAADAYNAQQQQLAQQQQMQQMLAQQQAQQAQLAQAQPAAGGGDTMAQLQKLGDMKNAGLLTDAEFAAAKAKILG